ncbi:MAG: serine hydroxymethyltransferase, partial [Clostridia bacterium]|nr:serine hydroxymethyltransferase [Clostridia bacterium]
TGKELEKRLDEVHITANKNTIPNDPQSPFITSGLRIGTPAVTSRGFGENEMLLIADFITDVINDFEGNKDRISSEVQALCEKFKIY